MSKSLVMRILTGVAMVLFCLQLSAQELITDRPDQTESAWTVPLKALQIESGVSLHRADNKLTFQVLQNVWRYSPVSRLEVRLTSGLTIKAHEARITQTSFDNLEAGLKFQFTEGKVPLALLSHLILPTGTLDAQSGLFCKLLWSHHLGPYLNVGYNVGMEYARDQPLKYNYSLSLSTSLTSHLGYYLEPFGTFGELHAWDTGLTYLVTPNVQLDFSMGFSFSAAYNYYAFGCSWRIPHQPTHF